jgi:hypothetical protein
MKFSMKCNILVNYFILFIIQSFKNSQILHLLLSRGGPPTILSTHPPPKIAINLKKKEKDKGGKPKESRFF